MSSPRVFNPERDLATKKRKGQLAFLYEAHNVLSELGTGHHELLLRSEKEGIIFFLHLFCHFAPELG